ncbi:MAG: GGDEF domain-containing protein [Steroidobacteraceae bacterium]
MQATAPYNLTQPRQAIDAQNKQIEIRLKVAAVEGDEAAFKDLLADLIDCRIGRPDERFRLQLEALEDLFLTLRSMALTDDLTRLYNRRGFLRAGTQLLDGLCRDGPAALLLYVDVDNLKYINDSSGHAAGDCVLRRTAEVLRDVFRESDVIGRLGGDEFAALTPMSEANDCAGIMHRMRQAIEASNSVALESALSLSIGFAQFEPQKPTSMTDLLQRADLDMYRSKLTKLHRRVRCLSSSASN